VSLTRHVSSERPSWDVASGGRLGMVTGEDATEVANPPTACTQNRIRMFDRLHLRFRVRN
jgi:hypothetical protein